MKRRTFFSRLFSSLGVIPAAPVLAGGPGRSILIQESPIAGFQFHRGAAVWSYLHVGLPVNLRREPSNEHDVNAVAVYFDTDQLGYVPRTENQVVARMLDRGEQLAASIIRLTDDDDPWERIRIRISLV